MQTYLPLIRFNFLRFLTYPLEIWAVILKYSFNTFFLCVFWGIIAKGSYGQIDFTYMVSYILLAQSIGDLTDGRNLRLAKYIGDSIKTGSISNILIKPTKLIPYMYFDNIGQRSLSQIIAIILIVVSFIIYPPKSLFSLLLAILFLVLACLISFAFNLFIATIYFYSPEARSIRFVCNHISSIFAGTIIPITFFPAKLKAITLLSPFPGMIFAPVNALKQISFSPEIWQALLVNVFWAIILPLLSLWWWKYSLKRYDAIGI